MALALALSACSRTAPPPEKTGELVVATRSGPTTYYIDHAGEPAGFEHDLVSEFGRKQLWTVRWNQQDDANELFLQVRQGAAHFAAAALPESAVHARHFKSGPVLFESPVQIVYRGSDQPPRTLSDMAGKKLALIADSGHTALLMRLKRKHPELQWETLENVWPEELLARLDEGEFDAVVINGMDFDLARNFYPGLALAFDLGEKQKIVWALSKKMSRKLQGKLQRFIDESQRDGTIKRIYERYYGHVQQLDSSDILGILERRPKLLPPLRRYFQEAQSLTGIDWRLLAAIGYQESQWNPGATSPTGVRGLMMLTANTADHLGVTNRLDARQSILGGARYLAQMKDALPESIPEPDRTWIAFAAYNQGQGHMEDARRIAQVKGGNPDSWADVKQALPLLGRGGYAKVVKYGYARGAEALIFSENIRNYYDILLRLEPEYKPYFNRGPTDASNSSPLR
jgi:membrane-bound lytic murein transglycosylase F